jgi:hypothetical protein
MHLPDVTSKPMDRPVVLRTQMTELSNDLLPLQGVSLNRGA